MTASTDLVMRTRAVGCVQTSSGVLFNVVDPRVVDVRLKDIARALSQQCRFSGQTSKFYSVAEHSIWVSHLVPPELARAGLLHDASEAYLTDLARPIKHLPELAGYRALEERVEQAIAARFELLWPWPDAIKEADVTMLAAECRQLMPWQKQADWWGDLATRELPVILDGARLGGMSPDAAAALFIARASQLGVR